MKHIFFLLIIPALAVSMVSCLTQSEITKRKKERAKDKITKILNKYPDLTETNIDTIIKYDTIINNKVIFEIDTFTLPGSDTTIYLKDSSSSLIDTIYFPNKIDYVIINKLNKTIRLTQKPKIFYIHDTLFFRDTIINHTITIEKEKIINVTKDFWFNLWLAIKKWIWWILIIAGIILILTVIIKIIK